MLTTTTTHLCQLGFPDLNATTSSSSSSSSFLITMSSTQPSSRGQVTPRPRRRRNMKPDNNAVDTVHLEHSNPHRAKQPTYNRRVSNPAGKDSPIRPPSLQHSASSDQALPTASNFAGCFVNSPNAASLLPPRWLQSATPKTDSDSEGSEDSVKQLDSASLGQHTPERVSSPASTTTTTIAQQETPLDRMFRADREERARKLEANARSDDVQTRAELPDTSVFNMESLARTVPQTKREAAFNHPGSLRSPSYNSGISADELDGNYNHSMAPIFSTPFNQRIREARQNSHFAKNTPPTPQSEDPANTLKRLLFGPVAATPSPQPKVENTITPPPFVPPQTSSFSCEPMEQRSPNVLAMENNLRRLLKLDSPRDSPLCS